MSISKYASVPISVGESSKPAKQAFLVRFPEDIWQQLEDGRTEGLSISFSDGINLHMPEMPPIPLTQQQNGQVSEIHQLSFASSSSQPALKAFAIASSRLSFPLNSVSTNKAADKLRAQSQAFDRERKDRAERVNGVKNGTSSSSSGGSKKAAGRAIPAHVGDAGKMGRSMSSPISSSFPGTGSDPANGATTPVIPLKTRVIQLLALGPLPVHEIIKRVGMSESEVMRVVRVVGKETSSGDYTLQPNKYAQVKIGTWKYTYAEKQLILKLAKEAFDEMDLPADADERADLDRKEDEVMNGASNHSSGSDHGHSQSTPASVPIPLPSAHPAYSAKPISSASSTGPAKVAKAAQSGTTRFEKVKVDKEKKKTSITGGGGLISKQKAKFAAEKRAASLPNRKETGSQDGSPLSRPGQVDSPLRPKDETASQGSPLANKASQDLKKRKRATDEDVAVNEDGRARKRAASPSAVSVRSESTRSSQSQSQEHTRGRTREVKPTTKDRPKSNQVNAQVKVKGDKTKLKAPERDYSSDSSSSSIEAPKRAVVSRKKDPSPISLPSAPAGESASKVSQGGEDIWLKPITKRKAPPPELKLNGHAAPALTSTQTHAANGSLEKKISDFTRQEVPDPEALRERYEELFPAYQMMTKKLAKLHRAAEVDEEQEEGEVGSGGPRLGVKPGEVEKMVARWEKWHHELEGIRRWFGEAT